MASPSPSDGVVVAAPADDVPEVISWLSQEFPALQAPFPGMGDAALTRLLAAVKGRVLEREQEVRRLRIVEQWLDRQLRRAMNRALDAAVAVVPDSPDGASDGEEEDLPGLESSPSPASEVSAEALGAGAGSAASTSGPPGARAGAPSPCRPSSKGCTSSARSRSRSVAFSSASPPPPGFDVNKKKTWPSAAPSDWCRACWPQVRGMRFTVRHDAGAGGRRCRIEPTGDGRPDLLFGQRWREGARANASSESRAL